MREITGGKEMRQLEVKRASALLGNNFDTPVRRSMENIASAPRSEIKQSSSAARVH